MKTYLLDLKAGENVEEFFLLKSLNIKTANNGNKYADMVLCDKTGDAVGKLWDLNKENLLVVEQLKEREIVKVRGAVTEWNGAKQIKVLLIRKTNEKDVVELGDFVKASPFDGNIMYQYIWDQVDGMKDEDYKIITKALLEIHKERLLYYPAAVKNHHAEMGGLLYHIQRMLDHGENVCRVYPLLQEDLLKCGIILHDIAKLDEIDADQYGMAEKYTVEGQLLGHIIQGIKMIDKTCQELEIPREKQILLEHMILTHHYEPEFGSPKKPLFPEAEMLHYLDIIDARMYDMENALRNVEEGNFTEKVWTLENRRLYKPKDM